MDGARRVHAAEPDSGSKPGDPTSSAEQRLWRFSCRASRHPQAIDTTPFEFDLNEAGFGVLRAMVARAEAQREAS
jgi:hypothetical protein